MQRSHVLRTKRHQRIRTRIAGTATRPRLSLYRSLRHLNAQVIDDTQGVTLVGVSDKSVMPQGAGLERAVALAKEVAKQAKEKQITAVVFDRGGFRYHGQVKAFAEALREAGITV